MHNDNLPNPEVVLLQLLLSFSILNLLSATAPKDPYAFDDEEADTPAPTSLHPPVPTTMTSSVSSSTGSTTAPSGVAFSNPVSCISASASNTSSGTITSAFLTTSSAASISSPTHVSPASNKDSSTHLAGASPNKHSTRQPNSTLAPLGIDRYAKV
ncbi:unnamed protein product [Protopolystoma xenopodis]|uniref:Uncharacterized protein n=1 Tax=Protopolystoma xenopodis TaxID=117903 RepID=A0A448XL53_9PLAT|nr:unnamed protein product [Protopolystoma xenopodis]